VTNNDAGTVSIDGRWRLITNTGANSISIIDTETDEVIKTSPVPKAPEGIAVKR
jgi:YVTN family beta-propeller protein